MYVFVRILLSLGIFIGIELVDYNVDAINWPWWASLLAAVFLSIPDIIFLFILDLIDD